MMDLKSAKLYFNDKHLADISIVEYNTPYLLGRHTFFDNDLKALLVKISQFNQSDIWLDDELDDDEQERKLNDLQKSLNISDKELQDYYYQHHDDWLIIMENGGKSFCFPNLDECFIEWR